MSWNWKEKAGIFDMFLDTAGLVQFVPTVFRFFFKKKETDEKRQEFINALPENLKAEAKDAIGSMSADFSDRDEFRLLGDVCWLVTGKKISAEEGFTFFRYLKACDEKLRTRFRKSYVSDKDDDYRRGVIMTLAKLDSDEKRQTYLEGPGLTDLTATEKWLKSFGERYEAIWNAIGSLADHKLPEWEEEYAEIKAKRDNKKERWTKPGTLQRALANFFRGKIL